MKHILPSAFRKKTTEARTKPKDAKIIIGRINDVETFPTPDAKGILISEPIVMKANAKMITLEVTPSTISITQPTEGDPDNKGVKPKIEFSRPGSVTWNSRNSWKTISMKICSPLSNSLSPVSKKLPEYPGNPLQLSAESTDNNEGDTHKVTLESVLRGGRIRFYQAALPAIDGVNTPTGSGGGQTV